MNTHVHAPRLRIIGATGILTSTPRDQFHRQTKIIVQTRRDIAFDDQSHDL